MTIEDHCGRPAYHVYNRYYTMQHIHDDTPRALRALAKWQLYNQVCELRVTLIKYVAICLICINI